MSARALLSACAVALFAAALPAAAQVRVTVDATKVGAPLPRAVLRGFNFGNWMAVADHEAALAEVPAGALRFPGGNIGDDQNMDEATLDTFASLLKLVRGSPELLIQTRVFEGRVDRPAANSPEDAAHAVRLARERGLAVPYWEIGNEPDLYATVRGDPRWTAERYCAVFRAQAAAIRKEDPKARIAGPATSAAEPNATVFLKEFVKRCGDVVDLLTWHVYPTGGDGTEADALASVKMVDDLLKDYRATWRDPKANPLGHARPVEFGVTEYGLSWRTDRPRFLADQENALWSVEAALRMAQGGIAVAHYFAYQGTGYHGLIDAGGVPRPSHYAFRLLGDLAGSFVPARSDDTAVWAHAARDGNRVGLIVINSKDKPQPVRIDAPGTRMTGARWFDGRIADEELPLAELAPAATLTLPARTMTFISLDIAP